VRVHALVPALGSDSDTTECQTADLNLLTDRAGKKGHVSIPAKCSTAECRFAVASS
jgi:hypothetical protein